MAIFGIIVSLLGLMVVLSILRGFVLSQLWGWFIVPIGVPSISVPQAIGIAIIASVLTYAPSDAMQEKRDSAQKIARAIGIGFGGPLACWGVGAIAACFV